ncbi:MAG: serine hydroxymethyltransferase, partial [Candidatus Limivicinus sp.]
KLTSGMRFGTPASTTRGMREEEMRKVAALIVRLLREGDEAVPQVKEQVIELCQRFPLYPEL